MAIFERVERCVFELERDEIQSPFGRPRSHRAGRRIADLGEKRQRASFRELTAEGGVAGVVDAGERGVKGHDCARRQAVQQREQRFRLRLRPRRGAGSERDVARVVRAALVADRRGAPVRCRKIAVEIDAARVAARAAQHPVGIAAEDDRRFQVAGRKASQRFRNDDRRLRFVAVNRGENQELRRAGIGQVDGERESIDRFAVPRSRVANEAAVAPLDEWLFRSLNHPGEQPKRERRESLLLLHDPDVEHVDSVIDGGEDEAVARRPQRETERRSGRRIDRELRDERPGRGVFDDLARLRRIGIHRVALRRNEVAVAGEREAQRTMHVNGIRDHESSLPVTFICS